MKIFNKDWLIDLEKSILWQYDKSDKLKSLITQKQAWYKENVTDFITNFFSNIFNLKTANDFGLAVWGKILNFPRQIKNKEDDSILDLSTEQYRFLLQAQVLKFKMKCTIPEINRYLRIIFNQENNENVYVVDNHDMTITYIIEPTSISEEIRDLIENYDFLPCPVGVSYSTTATTTYYKVRIIPTPSTAEVIFNIGGQEYIQDTIEVADGTTLTYTVRDITKGFVTQSQTITVTEDVNITVDLQTSITIKVDNYTHSTYISLTINGTTYTATQSITKTVKEGDTYSYSISKSDYPTKTVSGTVTEKIDVTYTSVSQQIVNINNIVNGAETLNILKTFNLDDDSVLIIDMCGGKGWENNLGTKAGGRVQVTANFNNNDRIRIRSINGVHQNWGIGIGLWLNGHLILTAGGAGFFDRGQDDMSAGGSGYYGGKAEGYWEMTKRNGNGVYSGTNTRRNMQDGDVAGTSTYLAYGGRGYVEAGYTNLATEKLKSLAYIKITQRKIVKV